MPELYHKRDCFSIKKCRSYVFVNNQKYFYNLLFFLNDSYKYNEEEKCEKIKDKTND